MAYNLLSQPNPEDFFTRVAALEALVLSLNAASLTGTHVYAGGYCPAALATGGTDTTGISTQMWVNELRVTGNMLITGLAFLIGSVGGTDTAIVVLYDVNGNVLANSALAGVTVGTASTFQRVNFVTPFAAGPGLYYVGVSTSGATAKIQTQAAGNHNAGIITGLVYATLGAITPPATFTAAKGPIVMTY